MAEWNIGPKNGMWNGGRSIASNGYVLIRVGEGHHLADVRGYAYEHRLVAEKKIGRRLLPDEQVHHLDEDKQNNDPDNILATADLAHHRVHHRIKGFGNRLPNEPNPIILCACKCGSTFEKYDKSGRPRLYVSGHNPPPASPTAEKILTMIRSGICTRTQMLINCDLTVHAVAVTLSKLSKKGTIIRVGKGTYALPEEIL